MDGPTDCITSVVVLSVSAIEVSLGYHLECDAILVLSTSFFFLLHLDTGEGVFLFVETISCKSEVGVVGESSVSLRNSSVAVSQSISDIVCQKISF